MPADLTGKAGTRNAPYNVQRLPQALSVNARVVSNDSEPIALETSGRPGQQLPVRPGSRDFISHLSVYLKSKNAAYKEELRKMEEDLIKAEETTKNLKETISALGKTVDALEGTLEAATHILSASLQCSICFEICSNPTSLKCGHSFCRDCLQSWFLSKFESKCEEHKIKLTGSQYCYIYTPSSTANETERNMLKFSKLSNLIGPKYTCPSCRDALQPSLRNSFYDFKLAASLNTLNALIGYTPANPPEWRLASIDMLAFLNSRLFQVRRYNVESDDIVESIDIDIE